MVPAVPASDVATRDVVMAWSNRLDGEYLTEAMPVAVREILRDRCEILAVAFFPQWRVDLELPLAEMLTAYYPRQCRSSPTAYAWVLRQEVMAPDWAALGAIKRVRLGQTPKSEFPPMPARLRAIAWGIAAPFRAERNVIGKLLAARAPRASESAAHRRNVVARLWPRGLLKTQGNPALAVGASKVGYGDIGACGDLSAISAKSLNLPDF